MKLVSGCLTVAAAGLCCAACAGSVGPAHPAGPAHRAGPAAPRSHAPASRAHRSLSVWLVLPSRTIAYGSSVSGRVIVDNMTGRPVPVSGCLSLFQVLLVGQGYRPEPAWLTCLQEFTIPVGESSYSVTVNARYNRCSESGGPGSTLPCMAGGQPPPLLPGDYHAVIFAGHSIFRLPPPVEIRVMAAQ